MAEDSEPRPLVLRLQRQLSSIETPLTPFFVDCYHHNRTGEDNADAHIKRQTMGREVIVALTKSKRRRLATRPRLGVRERDALGGDVLASQLSRAALPIQIASNPVRVAGELL